MALTTSKIVILVFERNQEPEKYVRLKDYIREEKAILSWWHYIPTAYLLETDESVNSLTDKFIDFFGEEKFFLSEVRLESCNGWLPEKSWQWIHKRSNKMEYSA